MNEDAKGQRVHPLFDPTSVYRSASRGPIWNRDHGVGSIKRFFVDLLRQSYLIRTPEKKQKRRLIPPGDVPPGDVPPGVFPEGVYALHYREWQRTQKAEQTAEVEKAVGWAGKPTPALPVYEPVPGCGPVGGLVGKPTPAPPVYEFVLDGRAEIEPSKRNEKFHYSGQSEAIRTVFAKPPSTFWINGPLAGAPKSRWVVLLVSPELIGELARILDLGDARPPDALGVLAAAVGKMVGGSASNADRRKFFTLSNLLALAPGLEGETTNGLLRVNEFFLDHPCPVLPSEYCLAVFSTPNSEVAS